MIIEKEIEEILRAKVLALIPSATVSGTWDASNSGEVKGEVDAADHVRAVVAVSSPDYSTFSTPNCDITVALLLVVRRELAPTAAELATLFDPLASWLLSLQADVSTVSADLSTSHFAACGFRLMSGEPPKFSSSSATWTITRSFILRGVVSSSSQNNQ